MKGTRGVATFKDHTTEFKYLASERHVGRMRQQAASSLLVLVAVVLLALPSQACIPGMPPVEFEPQATGGGAALTGMMQVTMNTQEELFAQTTTFKDRAYAVWQLEDFNESVKFFGVMSSFDGKTWSDPLYLTSHDITAPIRSELNINPRISADDERLYFTWATNEPNWTVSGGDDIVFRWSEDGTTWSEPILVTPPSNKGLDKLPRAVPFGGMTWFIWETNDALITDGSDMDVVARPWDGEAFGPVEEVTATGDEWIDSYVDAVSDGEHLYVTWMERNTSTGSASIWEVWGRVRGPDGWLGSAFRVSGGWPYTDEGPRVVAADGSCFFIWETSDTFSVADPTAIVLRRWDPMTGLGPMQYVSSTISNGQDSQVTALLREGRLHIVWQTTDGGISFGTDPDIVYRVGTVGTDGLVDFTDIEEVSLHTDDYIDQHPALVELDGVVYCVWAVDYNYTELLDPDIVASVGGVFRSYDIVIQAVEVPFEKTLSLVYSLGTASPYATYATTAEVVIKDLYDKPVEGLEVVLAMEREGDDPSAAAERVRLFPIGGGVYTSDEVMMDRSGRYTMAVLVEGAEVATFVVGVAEPPPSFVDRVPAATAIFVLTGAVTAVMLRRSTSSGQSRRGRESPAELGGSPT